MIVCLPPKRVQSLEWLENLVPRYKPSGNFRVRIPMFIGCIFFVWLSQTLAINGKQFAIIVMGLILVIATRFFPDGIILMLKN